MNGWVNCCTFSIILPDDTVILTFIRHRNVFSFIFNSAIKASLLKLVELWYLLWYTIWMLFLISLWKVLLFLMEIGLKDCLITFSESTFCAEVNPFECLVMIPVNFGFMVLIINCCWGLSRLFLISSPFFSSLLTTTLTHSPWFGH